MRTITCPYCDMDVSLSTLDAQDGCCPECGSFIAGRSSEDIIWDKDYDDDDDFFDEDDDFEDDDFEDDEFLDEDDDFADDEDENFN